MSFTRTAQGLTNEHLFHRVSYVLYCEGKPLEGEAASLDEAFWTKVFHNYGKSVHCKSHGSKTGLRQIADKVERKEVTNILVAFDKDYDDLRGKCFQSPCVIYSYGYSWENDALHLARFGPLIASFATITKQAKLEKEYVDFYKKQSARLRRVFALDYKYIDHPKALFDREKPLSIICFGGGKEPYVDISKILHVAKQMHGYRSPELPKTTYEQSCGALRFFGKVVAKLVYQWFVFRTRKIASKRSMPYDAFMAITIESMTFDTSRSSVAKYYSEVVAAA